MHVLGLVLAHVTVIILSHYLIASLLEPWLLCKEVKCSIGSYITLANPFIILLIEYMSID